MLTLSNQNKNKNFNKTTLVDKKVEQETISQAGSKENSFAAPMSRATDATTLLDTVNHNTTIINHPSQSLNNIATSSSSQNRTAIPPSSLSTLSTPSSQLSSSLSALSAPPQIIETTSIKQRSKSKVVATPAAKLQSTESSTRLHKSLRKAEFKTSMKPSRPIPHRKFNASKRARRPKAAPASDSDEQFADKTSTSALQRHSQHSIIDPDFDEKYSSPLFTAHARPPNSSTAIVERQMKSLVHLTLPPTPIPIDDELRPDSSPGLDCATVPSAALTRQPSDVSMAVDSAVSSAAVTPRVNIVDEDGQATLHPPRRTGSRSSSRLKQLSHVGLESVVAVVDTDVFMANSRVSKSKQDLQQRIQRQMNFAKQQRRIQLQKQQQEKDLDRIKPHYGGTHFVSREKDLKKSYDRVQQPDCEDLVVDKNSSPELLLMRKSCLMHKILINYSRYCKRTVARASQVEFISGSSRILRAYSEASKTSDIELMTFRLADFLGQARILLGQHKHASRAGNSNKSSRQRKEIEKQNEYNSLMAQHLASNSRSMLSVTSARANFRSKKAELEHKQQELKALSDAVKASPLVDNVISASDNAAASEHSDDDHDFDELDVDGQTIELPTRVRSSINLVRDGHALRAARRLTQNSEPISVLDNLELEQMRELHPGLGESAADLPRVSACDTSFITVDMNILHKMIRRLNNGSAPGLSGWTFDMLNTISQDNVCLEGIKCIVSDIINGKLPLAARDMILSSQLIAIPKKDSSKIRPIAVGECIYRLAATYAMSLVRGKYDHLNEHQYGVSIPGGAEQMIHEIQQELSQPNKIAILVDFANAFNSINRAAVLDTVYENETLSPLWNTVNFAYGRSTKLWTRDADIEQHFSHTITSNQGVRQGDPLSSLLFSLAIHRLLESIESKHQVKVRAYLDDVVIVGKPTACASALTDLMNQSKSELNLQVQPDKSMIVHFSQTKLSAPLQRLSSEHHIQVRNGKQATQLLGGFIGEDDDAVSTELQSLVAEKHDIFFETLSEPLLSRQLAMTLLRLVAAPKMNYLLRTHSPARIEAAAQSFSQMVITTFQLKFDIEQTLDQCDTAIQQRFFQQISLPISKTGFGLRDVISLSPACYISSIESAFKCKPAFWQSALESKHQSSLKNNINDCIKEMIELIGKDKVKELLPFRVDDSSNWISRSELSEKNNRLRLQKVLSSAIDKQNHQQMLDSLPSNDKLLRRHYECLAAASAHNWLKCLPTHVHLELSDEAMKRAACQRLFIAPSRWVSDVKLTKCPLCDVDIEQGNFFHSDSCTRINKSARHNRIRDLWAKCCNDWKITCSTEPKFRCPDDEKRPDLELLLRDKPTLVDITIIDPLSNTNIKVRKDVDAACRAAAAAKVHKYKDINKDHYHFVPLVFTTYGGRASETEELISDLTFRASVGEQCVYDPRETLYQLTHGISVILAESSLNSHHEWRTQVIRNVGLVRPAGAAAAANLRRAETDVLMSVGQA